MHVLETQLNYTFRDPELLRMALTHPSFAITRAQNYERLELLGDAVLSLVITEHLLGLFPEEEEGDIVKRRAALVNGQTLTDVAIEIGLGAHLILGESEEQGGGRENQRNLENAVEALIGALYKDGGFAVAKPFILARFSSRIAEMKAPPKDPKTALQEWAQGLGKPLPEYHVVQQSGPSHAPLFVVEVSVKGVAPAQAEAGTKRAAERLAAEALLAKIQ